MTAYNNRDSQIPVFASIYILIIAAVGLAVFLLMREKDGGRVVGEEPPAPPAPPKQEVVILPVIPREDPGSKKPDLKKVAKPATPKPEVKEPEPTGPTLSPEDEKEIGALYPEPDVQPLMEIVDHWKSVPKSAFPKLVTVDKQVEFEFTEGGKAMARGRLPAGSMLVPIRLEGEDLTVRSGSLSITITVPVDDTDFKEQIISRYESFVEKRHAHVADQRQKERERRLKDLVAESAMGEWNDGADPRFAPVKESLKKGEAGVYSLFDATKWRWGGSETVDETKYETAFVLIVTEAAFGVTKRELKVLIQDGKVVRWFDAATGKPLS